MSFNRLGYDDGSYKYNLKQSVSPGMYQVDKPRNDCDGCFFPDVIMDHYGQALYKNLIDVDSELLGITRKASDCPSKKYLPIDNDKVFGEKKFVKECRWLIPEATLLSMPKCTLHERGINRFEYLCHSVQSNALIPFDWFVSNRTITKDNHRPCIPNLIDQSCALPPKCNDNVVYDWSSKWKVDNTFPISVQIPTCKNISKLEK
jgi:hypothetical protein